MAALDAIVIGSGPNGLSAAATLARAGWSVTVREANETIGGGTRSLPLTLPGYVHDICSAVHPLAVASPFFSQLPLADHGLEWIEPPAALAHPFDDGTAAILDRSVSATAATLGVDEQAYEQRMAPWVSNWSRIDRELLSPLAWPRHPITMARFGRLAMRSTRSFVRAFRSDRAAAFFAGLAAHSLLPLERVPSAAFGLVLAIAGHVVGWPIPKGGAQSIADALASYVRSLGVRIVVGSRVESIEHLPAARAILCDLTPRQILRIAGPQLPDSYCRKLSRYRYGMAAYKMDWALDGPIPWRASACARAATVHLGGSYDEIAASESAAWHGRISDPPFVLLAQPSLFDPTRTPDGKHTVWAYCHVPNASTADMAERIEMQIERFAPGFRDRILARSIRTPADMERNNANLIGGDINGGVQDIWQLLNRPTFALYRTPRPGLYICSSSTPPGGGVHGMCGFHAAQAVLKDHSR